MAKRPTKNPKRRKPPVGCLVWLAIMLAIGVAFFATRASIAKAIDASRPTTTDPKAPDQLPPAPPEAPPSEPSEAVETPPARAPAASPAAAPAPPVAPAPARPRPAAEPEPRPQPKAAPQKPASTGPRRQTRQSALYFTRVGGDGKVTIEGVHRAVTFTDSPLTSTLEALIAGPLAAEKKEGLRTLIPAGTRVLEVRVEGKTAFIDLNEAFRFGEFGKDGLRAQLEQIVYTATEFDTVDRVQILIGGRITDFLGPEGIRIHDPLSRESFSDGSL